MDKMFLRKQQVSTEFDTTQTGLDEAKKEKVREYQTANKEYILQRKRDLYHQKQNIVNQSKSNNSDIISGLS